MTQSAQYPLHNTQSDEEMAAAIDAMLRADVENEHEIGEGASEETIAAIQESEESEDGAVPQIPLPKIEPVYTWPSHGLLIGELSYADFGDLGRSAGGGVGLGHVITTAENPKMIHLRNCIVLYKQDRSVRWLNQGKWYGFLDSDLDVVAVISSVPDDPRIANLQAIQQAESAREVLFSNGRSTERIQPQDRDWSQWP